MTKPDIGCIATYPTIPVTDVAVASEYYRDQLGFEVQFLWGEPPTHGAVTLGPVALHFTKGPPRTDGIWLYFHVEDVEELFSWYEGNDVKLLDKPTSQPWGMREFNLLDMYGYRLRFGQSDLKCGEPVPVQRATLTTRIERRLAELISDLADHKQMTVGEMLEETLLHSFESMPNFHGQGVASPHTARTMDFIAQLKAKHGIDYETHDAYRFQEQDDTSA